MKVIEQGNYMRRGSVFIGILINSCSLGWPHMVIFLKNYDKVFSEEENNS